MSERNTGYILLGLGILIMVFATIQIITVLTGKAAPLAIFKQKEQTTGTPSLNAADLLKQFQASTTNSEFTAGKVPSVQLIDPDTLNTILNLTLYYFIMQFLLSLGFKFASLGTQLLRPIQVHMKNRTLESVSTHDKTIN